MAASSYVTSLELIRVLYSRYNYHFGSIDSLNPDFEDPEKMLEPEQNSGAKNSSLVNDEASFENVKGFRMWTQKMMMDLLETKAKIDASHPGVEPGSSEFNKLLLKEFQKLHPKCMESSRSIYSKLQSIEKEDQFKGLRASLSSVEAVVKVEPDEDQVVPVSDEVCAINMYENDHTEVVENALEAVADDEAVIRNEVSNESIVDQIKTEPDEMMESGDAADVDEAEIYPKVELSGEIKSEDVFENSETSAFKGFEDWTIYMIRDFVACMDVTRKKFSQIKEKDPEIKLVPLLLEGWRDMYPGTTETVKTFQTRIKHLSQQKEIIKKHLGALRSNVSKTPEKSEEPFKWHKGMIQEVIDSRKRALTIKDAELKKGHKVSFHTLWASEFKRVYPNSTFTSNNLSVHFWTWRKQQQKSAAKKPKIETAQSDVLASAAHSPPMPVIQKSEPSSSGPIWNRALKIRLLECGRRVEEMMRDQETPNEIKLLGFPSMIYEEWKKANPNRDLDPKLESSRYLNLLYSRIVRDGPGLEDEDEKVTSWTAMSKMLLLKIGQKVEETLRNQSDEVRLEGFQNLLVSEWRKQRHPNGSGSESARSLSMMYNRLQREGLKLQEDPGGDSEPKTIMATWTPKHNRILLTCMDEFTHLAASSELVAYKESVIKSWRAKFTKSSISDAMLWRKIADLSVSTITGDQLTKAVKAEPEVIDLEDVRLDDSFSSAAKGEIVWNAIDVQNLFEVYGKAREEMSKFPPKTQPQLSDLVHANFVKLQPNCKLVPSVLLAKFFTLKTSKQFDNYHVATPTPSCSPSSSSISIKKEEIPTNPKVEENRKSKNLILRTWTQSMIDDMNLTRKIALTKKKKRLEDNPSDSTPMAEIWYQEFMKLHPEYKSTKKNLWRKYKWYRSRMEQDKGVDQSSPKKEEKVEVVKEVKVEEKQPLLRMKSIRKDVFTYLKSVLEEPRIFLPPKLSENSNSLQASRPPIIVTSDPQFLTPPPLQTFVRPITTFRLSGSTITQTQAASFTVPPPLSIPTMTSSGQIVRSNVAFISAGTQNQVIQANLSLQQQQQPQLATAQVLPVFPNGGPWQGLAPPHLTILPVAPVQESTAANNDSIKLPGGATLVAVTDRNVSQLLKPKQLEKPHVTITIGDRQEAGAASVNLQQQQQTGTALLMPHQPQATLTAIMTTPTQQIPLTIPYPINVPQFQARPSVVQPPPLPHLRPQTLPTSLASNQPSIRVRSRLSEMNIPYELFNDVISVYSATRADYISTLKKGYLAFFPHMVGAAWREKFSNVSSLTSGRKLVSLVDLHIEDRRKGRVASPEYLTKEPATFAVTELLLKQIIVCHAETRNWLVHQIKINPPLPAVYNEMCRRWPRVHPEVKMTTKQLISIHHMLNYEPGKDATPEVDCQLAEVWKIMDREVPTWKFDDPAKKLKLKTEEDEPMEYDDENVSMEQLQDWFLATENISMFKNDVSKRPRLVTRKVKLKAEDRQHLTFLNRLVNRRWLDCRYRHRRSNQIVMLHRTWQQLKPKSKLSKWLLMALCLREEKAAKKKRGLTVQQQIDEWRAECQDFCLNEESIFVLDEVEEASRRQIKREKDEMAQIKKMEASRAHSHQASGFSGRLTSLSRHANLTVDDHKRDYSKDENVLAYIGDMQKSSSNKGSQPITWTPEVIRDLMKARGEARRRKRIWEDWAVKKYGGVGIAYNMPSVKFTKVDDMFREEWIKLRPEMCNLSIWTLVSYARKFDNLKKQLIEANGGRVETPSNSSTKSIVLETQPAKPTIAMAFYPNSSIPMLNLEKVEKLKDIPRELKDLLKSRQLAKEKQIEKEGSKMTLNHLWQETWRELHPDSKMTGPEIQRLLFRYEQNLIVRVRTAPALIKKSETELGSDAPNPQPDEILSIKPRNFVFPENEGEEEEVGLTCYQNVSEARGAIRKVFATLDRDILRPNHPVFEIPVVKGKPVSSIENSASIRWPARGYNFLEEPTAALPDLTFNNDEGIFTTVVGPLVG